jgi:hypothetical protein
MRPIVAPGSTGDTAAATRYGYIEAMDALGLDAVIDMDLPG